jgi:hypothetical protein
MDAKNENIGCAVAEHLRIRVQFHRAEASFMDKPSDETRKRRKRAEKASDESRKALGNDAAVLEAVDRADKAIEEAVQERRRTA